MSVFSSYFWLWSIVGLLGLLLVSTLGAVLNMVGFLAPVKRATHWLDRAPTSVQFTATVFFLGLIVYPGLIHHLWAEATAEQTRRAFDALPRPAYVRADAPTEQMGGLFDPTGTDGTYILASYGTAADFSTVRAFYEGALAARGWVVQPPDPARDRRSAAGRLVYRDHAEPGRAQYELVILPLPAGTRDAGQELTGERTQFSVRLGVIDPRATTQVAWFIDCLVRGAPTFPTCEAAGWKPLEHVLGS